MHPDELLRPWFEQALSEVPGAQILDAHTHVGDADPDGFAFTPEALLTELRRANARAAVFPMHEPEGYRRANDLMIELAAASDGRLVPFCRVDPNASGRAEAERALDRGARGVKLHPRAERFGLDHPEVEAIAALAAERRVPVLSHAGRGIPALGRHALELGARHPDLVLILAHAGISDLAWIWRHLDEAPGLCFDTSWWGAADLLALFALVPPGRILHASDLPYGWCLQSATLTARCARQAGVGDERLAAVMGDTFAGVLAGEPLPDLGPAPGRDVAPADALLHRVHGYLVQAVVLMVRDASADESLQLARLALDVPPEDARRELCESIVALLERQRVVAAAAEAGDAVVPGGAPFAPGVHIVATAAGLALTPDAGAPDPDAL